MRKKKGTKEKTWIFRQGPWCPNRLPTRYTSCTKPTYKGHYTQGALQDRVNAEVGCVIGREHARAQSQHASGSSVPGRIYSSILSCLRQHSRPGPSKVGVPTVEILE